MATELYDAWARGAFELGGVPKQQAEYIQPGAYFNQARDYAAASFDSAQSLFQQLAQIQVTQDDVTPDYGGVSQPSRPSNAPEDIAALKGVCSGDSGPCGVVGEIMGSALPATPNSPSNAQITLPEERPAPSAPSTRPTITAPPTPGYNSAQLSQSSAMKGYSLPGEPDTEIPQAPELLSYSLPDKPSIIRNQFDEVLQAPPAVVAPEFSFTEPGHSSPIATLLNAKLNAWLQSEDVAPDRDIWDAIFARERDREESVYSADVEEARRVTADRGFVMPPGALNTALRKARNTKTVKLSSAAREQAIEEAKMVFENVRLAITQGVQYEGTLIRQSDSVAQRAYQAAVWVGDTARWVVTSEIELYNSAVRAYQVKSEVYLAWLQAELTKLEEYKAYLEAEQIKGQINREQLESYNLAIQAVGQQWDIYTKQLERVRIVLAENEQTIKRDELLIRQFEAVTKSNADQWAAYSAQWEGEKIKADIYKVDVDAYGEEVRAFVGLTEGDKIRSDLKISIEDLKNKNYVAKMDGVKAEYQALASRMGALAQTLGAQAQFADASGRYTVGMTQAETAQYRADVERYSVEKQSAIQEARLSLEAAVESARVAMAATTEAAKVAGQIASSALSILHVSASTSSSTSSSTSNSYASSESESAAEVDSNSYTKVVNCDCE